MSISQEDYLLMKELRDYATSYCTFWECSGKIGWYTDELINKTIACVNKIIYNRNFVFESCGKPIPTFTEDLQTANSILDGTFQGNRLSSVIERIL